MPLSQAHALSPSPAPFSLSWGWWRCRAASRWPRCTAAAWPRTGTRTTRGWAARRTSAAGQWAVLWTRGHVVFIVIAHAGSSCGTSRPWRAWRTNLVAFQINTFMFSLKKVCIYLFTSWKGKVSVSCLIYICKLTCCFHINFIQLCL